VVVAGRGEYPGTVLSQWSGLGHGELYLLATRADIDAMQQFTIAEQQGRPQIRKSMRRFGRFATNTLVM
jgi:hypothetical protein